MKEKQSDEKTVSEKPTREPCKECKWYDHETEREFRRKVGPKNEKGERTEIVETRAVCRGPNATAKGRLVHATLAIRECHQFEEGRYETPKEEEKKEPETPDEYHGESKETELLEREAEGKKK